MTKRTVTQPGRPPNHQKRRRKRLKTNPQTRRRRREHQKVDMAVSRPGDLLTGADRSDLRPTTEEDHNDDLQPEEIPTAPHPTAEEAAEEIPTAPHLTAEEAAEEEDDLQTEEAPIDPQVVEEATGEEDHQEGRQMTMTIHQTTNRGRRTRKTKKKRTTAGTGKKNRDHAVTQGVEAVPEMGGEEAQEPENPWTRQGTRGGNSAPPAGKTN
jgi:hypothetical protein